MSANNMENVIVPLFKTFEQLQADEEAIRADFEKDWNGAFEVFKVASAAVLDGSGEPLAKIVDTESSPLTALKKSGAIDALAKLDPGLTVQVVEMMVKFAAVSAEQAHLKKEITAGREAIRNLNNARRAAIEKRDERMFGHGALRRRSQRFASANERKNSGPVSA